MESSFDHRIGCTDINIEIRKIMDVCRSAWIGPSNTSISEINGIQSDILHIVGNDTQDRRRINIIISIIMDGLNKRRSWRDWCKRRRRRSDCSR